MAKTGAQSAQKSLRFTPSFSCSIKQEFIALCVIALSILIVRFQAITRLTTHYIGGAEGDAGLYIWLSQHFTQNSLGLPLFETQAFYPYSQTLAWSDNFILPSLFVWLLTKLGFVPIAAYNSLFLVCFLLNGYLTYRLAYRFTGKFSVALFPAVAVVSLSFLSSQLGHPQNQFIFFFPLALFALFEFLGSESIIWAVVTGLTIVAAFLTTVYYSIFLCIVTGIVFLVTGLLKPKKFSLALSVKLALGFLIGLSPILFFLQPYLDVKQAFGGRQIHEAYFFAVGLADYFSAYRGNLIYGALAGLGTVESNFFPGLLIVGLASAAVLRLIEAKQIVGILYTVLVALLVFAIIASIRPLGWVGSLSVCLISWVVVGIFGALCIKFGRLERSLDCNYLSNRDIVLIFSGLAIVFFVLSLGSLGNPANSEWTIGVYRLFYEVIPGFDSIRAISRCGIVVVYSLLMLATLGLGALVGKGIISERFSLIFLPLVLLENFSIYYPLQPPSYESTVFNQLSSIAKVDESVIILPMASGLTKAGSVESWSDYATINVNYMNWVKQIPAHLVNGYSGQRSHAILNYPRWLYSFPDEQSKKVLGTIPGLKYLVYVTKYAQGKSLEQILAAAQDFSWLKFISADDQGNILFKLQIESPVTSEFTILAPAQRNLALHLELSAPKDIGPEQLTIEVLCNGSITSTIKLVADGQWQQFSLLLPTTDTKVRPNKIQFRLDNSRGVFVRNIVVSKI